MAEDQKESPDLRELADEYTVLGELGRGGMAAVFLARHRRAGHHVAIKVIRGKYVEDGEAVSRFAREARTVARMQHPNIVRTYAVKRLRGDGLALVLQYVSGDTLRQFLKQEGALTFERAERILRDIAAALAFAHASGVVHRDVKPENIFVDRESGRALLADFGIATSTDGDSNITHTGMAIGTPAYMSPEQIDGLWVDGRSDLYSLGLVAWEMLTGQRPWAGESLYGLLYKQKSEQLPAITNFRPDVPARFLLTVEGALQKDATLRWATADDLVAQLSQDTPTLQAQRREAVRAELAPKAGGNPADDGDLTLRLFRPEPAGTPRRDSGRTRMATIRRRARLRLAAVVAATVLLTLGGAGAIARARWSHESGGGAAAAGTGIAEAAIVELPTLEAVGDRSSGRVTTAPADAPALPRAPEQTARTAPLLRMAREQLARGRLRAASTLVESALARDPRDGDAFVLRAQIRRDLGQIRDAWADAEVADQLGRHIEGAATEALLAAQSRDTAGARARLAALLRETRETRDALSPSEGMYLAFALMAVGNRSAAIETLESVSPRAALRGALSRREFDTLRSSPRFQRLAAAARAAGRTDH